MITTISILGLACILISFILFMPQIYRSLKTKSTKDLSYGTYCLVATNNSCWLLYGILIDNMTIVASDIVGIIACMTIVSIKRKYDKHISTI